MGALARATIEVLGWSGAALLLLAYARISLGRAPGKDRASAALNGAGSGLLLAHAAVHGAWPSATLNLLWLAVAFAAGGRAAQGEIMKPRPVVVPQLPAPAGHYVPAVVAAGLVFVSGQVAAEAGSARDETRQALRQVAAILRAAGSELERLVQLTIFVAGIEHWGEVDDAVREVLGEHRAARAVIPVGAFGEGRLVEVQAIGAVAP